MKYSLLIMGNPHSGSGCRTALNFAKALLAENHDIYRIFFYHDAVYLASQLNIEPQGELAINRAWQDFCADNKIDAVVCIAAAIKRGIINEQEAQRNQLQHYNLHPAFELSGLGQLADATLQSDRLLTFGV